MALRELIQLVHEPVGDAARVECEVEALARSVGEAPHAPLVVANVTAVVLATALNFLLNRGVTFKSASNPVRSLVLYLNLRTWSS